MKLKVRQIQQLDYILKLFSVFHKKITNSDSVPEFKLVFIVNNQLATGDFIQFASEYENELSFYEPGKTSITEVECERIASLRFARELLQKKTGINSFGSRDYFPYKNIVENPDVLLLFLLQIVEDLSNQTEKDDYSIPKVVKNVVFENSDYPFILLDDIEYDVIGLKEA